MRRLILALALAAGVATATVAVPTTNAAPDVQVLAPVAPSGPWQPFATPMGPGWALFDLTGRLVTVVPAAVLPPAPAVAAAASYALPAAYATTPLGLPAVQTVTAAPYAYPFGWPTNMNTTTSQSTGAYGVQSTCTCPTQ